MLVNMVMTVFMAVVVVIVTFVSLNFGEWLAAMRGFGRFRVRVIFEGVGGAQRFAFRAQIPRQQSSNLAGAQCSSRLQSPCSGLKLASAPSKVTQMPSSRASVSTAQTGNYLISW
jgi:hypothetical protein